MSWAKGLHPTGKFQSEPAGRLFGFNLLFNVKDNKTYPTQIGPQELQRCESEIAPGPHQAPLPAFSQQLC